MTNTETSAPAGDELLSVALLTLGCARNDVDSEELAGRLAADGFALVDDPEDADTVVVNTCGFVDAAKKDSIDTLLAAADLKDADGGAGVKAVVAVGCLAERYGAELADILPEADAVLGFDDYTDIASRLRAIVAGERPHAHTPQDRRKLLPISPADDRQQPGRDKGDQRTRPGPARLRPDGPPQAGQRLRPALHLLCDPDVPRLLRQPSPLGRAGRGDLAR